MFPSCLALAELYHPYLCSCPPFPSVISYSCQDAAPTQHGYPQSPKLHCDPEKPRAPISTRITLRWRNICWPVHLPEWTLFWENIEAGTGSSPGPMVQRRTWQGDCPEKHSLQPGSTPFLCSPRLSEHADVLRSHPQKWDLQVSSKWLDLSVTDI